MKKILYYILIPGVLASTGCKKFLDQEPISDLSPESFWKSPDDARTGVAAIYDGIQRTLNGNYTDWGDARSDNFTYGGTGENQINVTLNGLNSLTGAANWNNLYLTIGRANLAIKYLPDIALSGNFTELQRNNYLAQAYAIRAYMYFFAIRLWGGVPVSLEPYEDLNEEPLAPRTPADEVLNNVIIPDLTKAYSLVDKTSTNIWEMNAGAILALLTDVYMWKKDYTKALESSQNFISLSYRYDVSASNSTDWKKIFLDPASTKEAIWSMHWDYTRDGGNGISKIGSGGNTSQYYIDSTVFLRYEMEKNDIRRAATYDTAMVTAGTRLIQIGKFYPLNSSNKFVYPANAQNEAKLTLYRTADVLLLRAEALNKTSANKAPVFTIVNRIRTLRGLTPLAAADYPTERDVETAILNERQLELFGEGKRWFDLVRTGRVIEVMDPLVRYRQRLLNISETGFDDPRKILWPISRQALTRNTLIRQNDPYSE
ncbi:RagB/SusD family nutrient uptake outer membrane protein [Longitalea luteola]|uniref:RagB/SusD family nutrient uptake outer membrane protein n=1 Tax=Longitalea luteola TaxID=2812563 RepID=UPI001A96050F|nr:RagB/SusD family nutrient uptake outer membrane protein [Longitalea luteola]